MEYNIPSINLTVVFGLLIAIGYVCTYVAFVNVVVGNSVILNGYPRDDLKPGAFVSDRYGYGWFFLVFTMIKVVVPLMYLFTIYDFIHRYKRVWFDFVIVWVGFVLDVALWIFFFVVSCFRCNSTYSAGSPCNAPLDQWCAAFGPSHPDRCKPGPVTIDCSQSCQLSINQVFVDWMIFVLVFTILDWVLYSLNDDMEFYIRQYIIRNVYVQY
jgi:hypothetical protein